MYLITEGLIDHLLSFDLLHQHLFLPLEARRPVCVSVEDRHGGLPASLRLPAPAVEKRRRLSALCRGHLTRWLSQ